LNRCTTAVTASARAVRARRRSTIALTSSIAADSFLCASRTVGSCAARVVSQPAFCSCWDTSSRSADLPLSASTANS
jgi:hypothetical protein